MNEQKTHQFKAELRSFFAIIILNMMFAALALGMGISVFITQILAMIEAETLLFLPILYMIVSASAFILGFFWLIVSAELLDDIDDITSAYDDIKKNADDEHITSLIIRLLAQYRSKKPSILRMTFFATIGGIVFIVGGILGIVLAIVDPFLTPAALDLLQLGGGIVNIGIGIVSFMISRYFRGYTRIWDRRLQKTTKVEEQLMEELGCT